MVNKTQFYKTKVALAVVVSLGLTACGGGDDSTANSNANTVTEAVDNTIEQVSGTGSVQGTVLNTNGLPVMGATVSLSGQTVQTDASGYYHFTDVPLPGVDGVNGEASDTDSVPYLVTITGPEGYASATVTVQSEDIQVDSNANGIGTDSASDSTAAGEALTWFDGFLAQAQTTNLPMFSASVSGVLRNCHTGALLPAGTKVALDFKAISTTGTNTTGSGSAIPGAGTNVTIGVPTFVTTTGADGVFSFDALPTDSDLALIVEGYAKDTTDAGTATELTVASVLTIDEGVNNNLGDIAVCAITSSDDVDPYITNATGFIGASADFDSEKYAMLNRGIDQTFTLWFNEPVNAETFNADDVLVTLANAEYLTVDTATLAADGKSLTVVLTEALEDGEKISIFIPWADATDVAGNFFDVTVNNPSGTAGLDIDWDYKTPANSGKAVYLKANLCTFIEPTTGGSGITTQVIDQVGDEDGDSKSLAAYSNAYIDSREDLGDSIVQQVNGSDSAERLSLFRAIQGGSVATQTFAAAAGGETTTTLTAAPTGGLVSFTINGVDSAITSLAGAVITHPALVIGDVVVVRHFDSSYDDRASRATIEFDGSAIATASLGTTHVPNIPLDDRVTSVTGLVKSTDAVDTHFFDIGGVDHNDQAHVAYTDDLGVLTKLEVVTFTDQAKPTTVIQDDYDLHDYNNTGTYTATVSTTGQAQYGNGGETSHALISEVPGNPTIYIQPRHLAQKSATGVAPVRGTEFNTLVADMNDRLDTGEAPAAAVGGESSLSVFDAASTNQPAAALYDATAIASWSVGQDIGVAFSETIKLSAGAPTYTGTESLSGYQAENSVTSDVDTNGNGLAHNVSASGLTKEDIVMFTTSDVVELANTDNGAILGFAGAVADSRGNVADVDTNAQVVLLDAMPVFVTAANWTGTDLEITFNEAIVLHATTARTIEVFSPTDSSIATASGVNAIGVTTTNGTLTNSDKTLTIALSTAESNAISLLFQNGNDNEFLYDDDGTATDDENHAVLAWDGIVDTNNNAWSTFDNGAAQTERYEVRAPRFLMVNGVGTFTYSVATSGYLDTTPVDGGDDNGAVSYTITFTHPINLYSPYDVLTLGTGTATDLATAIQTAEGTTWSSIGTAGAGQTATSWNSTVAADLPVINAIFDASDLSGNSDANLDVDTDFVSVLGVNDATANVTISADRRIITLNVQAQPGGIDFGKTTFTFKTEIDSNLIVGAKTAAGQFNWQNTQ